MIRGLTPGERGLAVEAFGDALAPEGVRFLPAPWPFDRAFVPGRWFGRDWIVWPRRTLPPDIAAAPLRLQALLVHELTHVWQAQQGVNLLTGKLRAGDRPSSYHYPVGVDCDWGSLNIEQQAMIVEHRFRLSRGQKTPADAGFYNRVCPVGPRASSGNVGTPPVV
ncbi:MAG: hypothetical protein KKC29_01825 [Alphaproteobacteria bacterium]|nr:hypothetical protein [Alphaproteobacteria bacterium]MBU2042590.1 hypothetical protein [Alphaproteobacteria bacterium]MBU2124797.1 hypothetical protein [Alphaproteobacteria bacterium]MBU2209672.1 hypothetical protein [Alphaproteobacteria bacterium]MBU2289825.1 hypothetical protein [Alphaproteobacteria bacterium]